MADRRLIEAAFPLKQVSLDSVHEKNVRHGHISTLHIWPARRPLAASRAALLATLLPDPGSRDARRELLERMAGSVVERPDGNGRREETHGGILHWGREQEPEELAAFRREIRQAFGGRAPRVLDPFAGGGAIPLEAMRLGCETVAADINPVAWFILRCTLHYPRLLAGRTRPLPAFALEDRSFAEAFVKQALGITNQRRIRQELARYGHGQTDETEFTSMRSPPVAEAGAAWHLRAWGQRVLDRARRELAARYPTYAEFEPARRKGAGRNAPQRTARYRPRPPRLLEPDRDGRVSVAALNAEFDEYYLEDEANPRWVAKPAVAYLWARTIRCRGCRAEIPLLKTRWLCRKANKRVLLTMAPRADGAGVTFGVAAAGDAPGDGGAGTMHRSGATCPCCGDISTMEDMRVEARAGRMGERMTAVVVDGQQGKEYRLPTEAEIEASRVENEGLVGLYADVPFGLPTESTPKAGGGAARAFSVDGYGFDTWRSIFTDRQLLALGVFVREIRQCAKEMGDYPESWREAIIVYLCCVLSKLTDYSSTICSWVNGRETLRNTFARFALPIVWDYCEVNPLSWTSGGFVAMTEWVARYVEHAVAATVSSPAISIHAQSAIDRPARGIDLICTDPPYYDAIPYSDLMDFFHVWLRRALHGLSPVFDAAFARETGPKWDAEAGDGELIDDASRFGGDRGASKRNYETGMARAFSRFYDALRDDGRLVIVFANKSPDAWETLVSALIRAGFVVTGSWPIQTERQSRQRSLAAAALASSIWLVCRKRPAATRPGWDGPVLDEMQEHVTERLRDFWDAGIRGPDFVWAATGPALEAFSRHPVVKMADRPGERLTVAQFLRRVRRMVVGFVVSRLLRQDGGAADELDDPTTYYLLHRNDFGLGAAQAGACILYALSCNLSDAAVSGRLDLLVRGAGAAQAGDEEEIAVSGSQARLKPWHRRRARDLGEPAADGAAPPLIDRVHKLMQLWKTGELSRVNGYLDARGLWRHELFARVVQALIELAEAGSEERALLESIQNHLRGHAFAPQQGLLLYEES